MPNIVYRTVYLVSLLYIFISLLYFFRVAPEAALYIFLCILFILKLLFFVRLTISGFYFSNYFLLLQNGEVANFSINPYLSILPTRRIQVIHIQCFFGFI